MDARKRHTRDQVMTTVCRWLSTAACLALLLAGGAARADEFELKNGKWVRVPVAAEGTSGGEIELIRRHVRLGENRSAVGAADDYLEAYPQAEGRQEAMKLAAQAEMNRKRYWQAYEWYRRLWEEAPGGEYSDLVLEKEFEIAEAFLQGEKRIVAGIFRFPARGDGQEILRRIVEQAPGSQIAESAMYRLAEDYRDNQEYVEAAEAFDQFIELFGKSKRLTQATAEAARAVYLTYRGQRHDPTPLIESEQRYREIKDRHPALAERAQVDQTLADIRNQRGASDLEAARLYERIGRPASAAFYFRIVRDRYAGTPAAEEAIAALARLGSEAGAPPPPVASQPASSPGATMAPDAEESK